MIISTFLSIGVSGSLEPLHYFITLSKQSQDGRDNFAQSSIKKQRPDERISPAAVQKYWLYNKSWGKE
jgi:hypothetical protein